MTGSARRRDRTTHHALVVERDAVPASSARGELSGDLCRPPDSRMSGKVEGIAVSLRESFLLTCLCFLQAMGPMLWLCRRAHLLEPGSSPSPRVA